MDIGATLGHYRVTAALGAGGMGEVYRATDTKLGRDVALKMLPDDFADDSERHARFEREAKLLASLNHPNIATLHGLEHLAGKHALVMELVEGEGLDEVVARGPIAVDEAISIALQIAMALEAAHEHGIVHRDLKPANVIVCPDGTVKVLDFGLAKTWEGGDDASSLSLSPTLTAHATQAGVILGTAAYMAPEQARGKSVDKRADIWAFGVVVWEMLTGQRMFAGETVTDVLAGVLKQETDWTLLPPATPPGLRRLLERCLERRPSERIRDMGDVRWELAESARPGGPPATAAAERLPPGRRSVFPWIIGIGVGLGIAGVLALAVPRPHTEPPRTVRSFIAPPDDAAFDFSASVGGPVLSPDGSKVVFPARDASGGSSLWIRPLDSLTAQPLSGTEGAFFPFWSPDSRWVGYFIAGKMRKIDVRGGPPQSICDAVNGRGGAWNSSGMIVFAPDVFGGLQSVPAVGGTPSSLTELDTSKQHTSQRWPEFLPDGRHFLFWAGSPLNSGEVTTDGIYVASLDEPDPVFLFPSDSDARYAAPGYLLFLRSQALMVRRFEAATLRTVGEAVPIAEHISSPQNYRRGHFSVSQQGTMVYVAGETSFIERVWLDSSGRQLGELGEPAAVDGMRLSPDGKLLVEQVSDARSKNIDLWVVDIARDVRTRFTFAPGLEMGPVWSPDGRQIAYTANPKGKLALFVKAANGAGQAQPLLESDVSMYATDWSPDGKNLAVMAIDPRGTTVADIWIVPMEGEHTPKPFLATQFFEADATFSPDGRWLTYTSNESGKREVYLTPFPGPGGKWQVSQGGGSEPVWRHDGGALFFRSLEGSLFEAGLTFKGPAVEVGPPRELFEAFPNTGTGTAKSFAVPPEGDRYLFLRPIESGITPVTLVTNWTTSLDR